MNKHEKKVNVVLVILASISIMLFALVFVFDTTNDTKAQITNFSEITTIFFEQPDVLNGTTFIRGQQPFTFRFTGAQASKIEEVRILVETSASTLRQLHCIDVTNDPTYRWFLHCDTLGLPNGGGAFIRIEAFVNGSQLQLKDGLGNDPYYGPVSVQNNYGISSPSIDGDTFSQAFPIQAGFTGDVSQAKAKISPLDGTSANLVILDLNRLTGSYQASSWGAEFDATSLPDGDYQIALNAIALGGEVIDNLAYRIFNVSHPITTCTAQWNCTAWSTCINNQQTRTCTDANSCGTTTSQPPQFQTCTSSQPPSTNSTAAPSLSVTMPIAGVTLSGDTQLRVTVEGTVDSLAFFYRVPNTNVEHLIGDAIQSTNNPLHWGRTWRTVDVPDQGYYIFARATSDGATYISNFVNVAVYNTVSNDQTSTTTDEPPPPPDENFSGNVDTDGDSVNDQTEDVIGSDINSIDTDQDSATAVLDLLVQSGDVTEEQLAQIKQRMDAELFQQPTTDGVAAPKKLRITKIENNRLATGDNELIIIGIGPPNTFVTLFIYSNPIVVTTKTDASGNFTYTLDRNVLDGEHEVYVTVTDQTGKIEEKSSPFAFFVRSAQAVSEDEYLRGNVDVQNLSDSPVSGYVRNVVLIVLTLVGALMIGWLIKRGRSTAE